MRNYFLSLFIVLTSFGLQTTNAQSSIEQPVLSKDIQQFLSLISADTKFEKNRALSYMELHWKPSFEIMALELMYFGHSTDVGVQIALLLQKKTGKNFGFNFNQWYEYLWNKEEALAPQYDYFKARLHQSIDAPFAGYFLGRQYQRLIRFDEIRWGGVVQDGIPPLRNPKMISAKNATYLEDDHVVFGIEVNGDARAYPKRILAWHEMFVDTVGEIPVAGVYCTLCGTVILYKTEVDGVLHEMGTSGFLYRSNKLMYDKATQSLWSTLEGKPVVGPLVGKGIQMEYLSVVTTTWGEWKKRHPTTQVLSTETGFRRDYGEGVAYQSYFATDELMFNVPTVSKKLKNKQSILAIRLEHAPDKPLAISVDFLKKTPVYTSSIEGEQFTVFTDTTGANRVYSSNNIKFKAFDGNNLIEDSSGRSWQLFEDRLESETGEVLNRLPTFNAFWFGWQAAYPNTKLIQ